MVDPSHDAEALRPGNRAVRASDADRERAIERLRTAAADGRVSLEELTGRVEATARALTRADLDAIVGDLGGAPAAASVPAPGSLVSVPTRNTAVFRNLTRADAWCLPGRSRWENVFGDIELDLREAQMTSAAVDVHASTVYGDVELLVPGGVLVEVRVRTFFGDIKQDAGEVAPSGAPQIVLTGWTVFGDVRVHAHPRRPSLAQRWLG